MTPPTATARSARSWPSGSRGARARPGGQGRGGRLGKREFQIDLDAGTVTCPGGQTVAISVSKNGDRGANFARACAATAR